MIVYTLGFLSVIFELIFFYVVIGGIFYTFKRKKR